LQKNGEGASWPPCARPASATWCSNGNAWQGDYLRYGADFGILEGHGIALIAADGEVELFLDSATDAERAELEAPLVKVHLAPDIARVVGARLDRVGNAHIAAAPRRFLPRWLADATQNFKLDDATALLDQLADAQERKRDRGGAPRRAGRRRGLCRVFARGAAGPAPVRDRGRYRGASSPSRLPGQFMIIGSGGKDVFGMTPPSERRIAAGDLVTTELTPAVEGYFAQICRTLVVGNATEAQRRAFAVFVEALEAGIAAVRPGVRAADVAKAENDVFRKHGLGEYTTSQWTRVRGHGMGLFADSKPHILEDVDTVLEPA